MITDKIMRKLDISPTYYGIVFSTIMSSYLTVDLISSILEQSYIILGIIGCTLCLPNL